MKNGNCKLLHIKVYQSVLSLEVRSIPNTQRNRVYAVKPPDIIATFLRKTFTIKTTFISLYIIPEK